MFTTSWGQKLYSHSRRKMSLFKFFYNHKTCQFYANEYLSNVRNTVSKVCQLVRNCDLVNMADLDYWDLSGSDFKNCSIFYQVPPSKKNCR